MFQSTPFARRETTRDEINEMIEDVSIHSLRKKGDDGLKFIGEDSKRFNPLPSQEGRQLVSTTIAVVGTFQSTPFARRETLQNAATTFPVFRFNPLPSQEGRRNQLHPGDQRNICFNPLPSQEGRHGWPCVQLSVARFNPLPSQEGRRRARCDI